MFKLPCNCTHFTCQQDYAQNPSSQASAVCEPRISKCIIWIQKRQRNQRSNCQHPLDHRKKCIPCICLFPIYFALSQLFVVIHKVKGFSIVNETQVQVFSEFPCFFYEPVDAGNLISGFSASSKSSLYIWKFSVHVLLKPSLKDFEHNLASM